VEDCKACGGSGVDDEAEFDRACLRCNGYGTEEAADEYNDQLFNHPYYFSGTTNEEGEVYGG
jgi:hypothetical protein